MGYIQTVKCLAEVSIDPNKDPDYDDMLDLYMHGDCATFAVALNKELGYPIQLALYVGKYRNKKARSATLIHACGMKGSSPVDFTGKHTESFKALAFDFFYEASAYGELGDDASPDLVFIEDDWTVEKINKKFGVGQPELEQARAWIKKYTTHYK